MTEYQEEWRYLRSEDKHALSMAPKFRILSVLGWSIVICRDYKEDDKR